MEADQIHAALLEEIGQRSRLGRIRRALQTPGYEVRKGTDSDPQILFVSPWLDIGGAELVGLEIMRGLQQEFRFAVATTLDHPNPAADRFRELPPYVYEMGTLGEREAAAFLPRIVAQHGIGAVVINWCKAGYEATRALKSIPNVWVGNIIHNNAPEGWINAAVRQDRYIDRHFPVSNEIGAYLTDIGQIASNKIEVVRNGVDVNGKFNPASYEGSSAAIRSQLGIEENALLACFVGRLSEEKDPRLFVETVRELTSLVRERSVRALIVGDGAERQSLEEAVRGTGLVNVVAFLGARDDVAQILSVSDYLLLTSRLEGAPLVPLEAMSMGVPVVSTDVGNVREIVVGGVNGRVVEERDPAHLAKAVFELETSSEVSPAAVRASIAESFNRNAMVEAYAREFRTALDAYNP